MSRRTAIVILSVLSAQLIVLGALEAWRDSLTDDEGIRLAAGVTALTRHDLRLNPEDPPLAKVVAAAPALLARPVVPSGASWERGDTNNYADEFVTAQRRSGKLRRVLFLARLPSLVQAVLAGALIYGLGSMLVSRAAGALSASLWLTAPFVVGLGHLQSLDLSFTVTVLGVALLLVRYLDAPDARRLAAVAVACGVSLLVRSYALLLVPTVAAVVCGSQWRRGARRAVGAAAVVLVVAWATVWLGTRAIAPSPPSGRPAAAGAALVREASATSRMARLVLAAPWPSEYETGVAYLSIVHGRPAPAYLVGEIWTGARWWYWPVAMAVKFPGSTLVTLLVGIVGWRMVPERRRRSVALGVAVPATVLVAFILQQGNPIGLRYLLPVIALGLVVAGPLVLVGRQGGAVMGAVAVGVQVVVLWGSYPTTLSWTAPPFRPGYRATADSNLDWGQDLGRLAAWSRNRTPDPYIAYVGPRGVGAGELPETRLLSSVRPERIRGWVAVSARLLIVYERDELAWLRAYCPVGTVGGSILVYRFDRPPVVAPGPTAPRAPCAGRYSVRGG